MRDFRGRCIDQEMRAIFEILKLGLPWSFTVRRSLYFGVRVMSGVNSSQQDVDIDLGQLFRAVWRRRIRVVAITLAGACLALTVAKLVSPEYRSETRVLIEQRAPAFATATEGNEATSGPLLDELNIASQVQILQSADLIKQVI